MNKLYIIGNLTRDPELRNTAQGISVCSFTVAVNRRRKNNQNGNEPDCDFFKVTAWRERGETCGKYLTKGSKVAVIGAVELKTYTANDGTTRANMEITADDVEFLSPKTQRGDADDSGLTYTPPEQKTDAQTGFAQVEMDDSLPF